MLDQIDLFEYLDIEDLAVDTQITPAPKARGRPPLKVLNPLDDVPPEQYANSEGRPFVWLDDCLMGAIRACGTRDSRLVDTSKYVSQYKVFKTLSHLRGELTPKRVAQALGVSLQTGWRIVSVIGFASFSIERDLKRPNRIIGYGMKASSTTTPRNQQ
jgi:hypothetical protein